MFDGFMIQIALHHGFEPLNEHAGEITEYQCTEASLLALMKSCVEQGEKNANAKVFDNRLFGQDGTVHDKLDRLLEQTKPKDFKISYEIHDEVGVDLKTPGGLKMTHTNERLWAPYGRVAETIKRDQRITELQKEIDRVLEDKRKMYEPPTNVEVFSCSRVLEMDHNSVALALQHFVELRKASTTYDNQPKSAPEKIAEPTVTEINNIREAVAESFNYNPDSKNMTKLLTEAITRFVELRNKD